MSKRNDLGQTENEFRAAVENFGTHTRRVKLEVPEPLNKIADAVLAYRPKATTKKAKKRRRKASKQRKSR